MTAIPKSTEFDLHPDAILLEARKIEASREGRVFIASQRFAGTLESRQIDLEISRVIEQHPAWVVVFAIEQGLSERAANLAAASDRVRQITAYASQKLKRDKLEDLYEAIDRAQMLASQAGSALPVEILRSLNTACRDTTAFFSEIRRVSASPLQAAE